MPTPSHLLCPCCKQVVPRLGSLLRMWKGLRRRMCAGCARALEG